MMSHIYILAHLSIFPALYPLALSKIKLSQFRLMRNVDVSTCPDDLLLVSCFVLF